MSGFNEKIFYVHLMMSSFILTYNNPIYTGLSTFYHQYLSIRLILSKKCQVSYQITTNGLISGPRKRSMT